MHRKASVKNKCMHLNSIEYVIKKSCCIPIFKKNTFPMVIKDDNLFYIEVEIIQPLR